MASIQDEGILIAQHGTGNSTVRCFLRPDKANRHGLITGATGTGKATTLPPLAEGFSSIGVPVFMADGKGDLTGISQKGTLGEKLGKILKERGIDEPAFSAFPTTLWDVFGQQGHPVRATVSDLGPLLLARMLNLNETQAGVLQLVFKIADDDGLLLLDMKDLRAMCQDVGENASHYTTEYGNISAASIGAIQRGLMQIEEQGGDQFFGEPMLNIADFMQTDGSGKGVVNILAADKLMQSPRLYATFLLWMLSELFEALPEVGDLDKPKLVFFFDEAHLLFADAPKVLIERIELVVRLVRSKGVGVYFVTQNPLDIPDSVLAQLGNRVQHALRAFTPRDQKAVKATATTMRQKPGLDIETAITELAVGEALVASGFRTLEVPLNRPGALECIATLARTLSADAIVGGGTMLTVADVEAVHAAGGRLMVSPNCDVAVIRRAVELGMLTAPGVATPTEAFAALQAGAHALKLFPAEMVGHGGIKALKSVLPAGTDLWPVGGITPESMGPWKKAG
eukprot:gene15101-32035_t